MPKYNKTSRRGHKRSQSRGRTQRCGRGQRGGVLRPGHYNPPNPHWGP